MTQKKIIENNLKQQNFYWYEQHFYYIKPDGSILHDRVQIAFYKPATQEQYTIIQQLSDEAYNIKYYTTEISQTIVERVEAYKADMIIHPGSWFFNPLPNRGLPPVSI